MPAKALSRVSGRKLCKAALGLTVVARHASIDYVTKEPTVKGVLRVAKKADLVPKSFRLLARQGDEPRHFLSANVLVHSFKGEKNLNVAKAPELGLQYRRYSKDSPLMQDLRRKFPKKGQAGIEFMKLWLDGKVSPEFMEKPEVVGREVLQRALQFTSDEISHSKAGTKRPLVANVSSREQVSALLKFLGIDIREITPRHYRGSGWIPIRATEHALIYHLPEEKFILWFRGRYFDITTQARKLLA
ncbi:MAG TPA: hypothetical protein HA222_04100 [Candidatus Diapherotrites archaeon]|uniref:Uncharacterized protein n=1 Tax=Candidatus Iainarchaeum sp. TaxID=3101447 RepID=A0A7J4JXV2_9ARCH|nr:hypothetical protein [Candidatus Diapherotrites archaeon]